jgi:hypothetical protein
MWVQRSEHYNVDGHWSKLTWTVEKAATLLTQVNLRLTRFEAIEENPLDNMLCEGRVDANKSE